MTLHKVVFFLKSTTVITADATKSEQFCWRYSENFKCVVSSFIKNIYRQLYLPDLSTLCWSRHPVAEVNFIN